MGDAEAGTVDEMPIPMGVIAETGETHPPLTDEELRRISPDTAAVLAGAAKPAKKILGLVATVDDANDLAQAGWSVLFASDADPAIKAQLHPLIDRRRSQVNDDELFRVFEGNDGVRVGQSVMGWLSSKGLGLNAPVDPSAGVPYYVLIVGSPSRIPFEFQQQLDLQWAVGRLHFETAAEYGAYAEKVIAYEKGEAPARRKDITLWMPRNPKDGSTAALSGTLGPDFTGSSSAAHGPIGHKQGFRVTSFIGDGQATKETLEGIFRGAKGEGPPAILFSGSHGAEINMNDLPRQRREQGALVTQEWTRGKPLEEGQRFTADDLARLDPATAVHGLMVFLFACFSGGCPKTDSYVFNPDGSKKTLTPEPLIAQLPQALLTRGALAVVAHVDRAFSYGFADVLGTPQVQLIRTPLELLMKGKRVGLAVEALNDSWKSLAAQLGKMQAGSSGAVASAAAVARLIVAREDAANYMVLGDPAVCLNLAALQ